MVPFGGTLKQQYNLIPDNPMEDMNGGVQNYNSEWVKGQRPIMLDFTEV